MSIEVRHVTESDREQWNSLVERSPHGTPFHLREFGELVGEYADMRYTPLVGYKGQEPVGLFPTFLRSHGPLTSVFSPPPALNVSYQGPAMVNIEKLKQRKVDKRHSRFIDGCLDLLDTDFDPQYVHVRSGSRFRDTRPFLRRGYDASPSHTYVVDIEPDEQTLLNQFSRDARQNITGDYEDVTLEVGSEAAVRTIMDQVRARHREQSNSFGVSTDFVVDLFRQLPAGVLNPYVCRVDGDFASGMIALELGETVYRWMGGTKHDFDVPVNDLVDWHIICDAKSRDVTRYDLVGAYQRNIARYKAKFAPSIEIYQQLEWGTTLMRMASNIYKRVKQ